MYGGIFQDTQSSRSRQRPEFRFFTAIGIISQQQQGMELLREGNRFAFSSP